MPINWEEAEKVARAFAGHTAKGWIRTNCPLHEDYKESLGLNTKTGGYHCFKCGIRGWIPPELRDLLPIDEEDDDKPAEPPKVMTLPEGFIRIYEEPGLSAQIFEPARNYMRGRKNPISDSICAAVGVGAVLSGWLVGRVIIPLYDRGTVKGWVARDYTKRASLPYLYPKGLDRSSTLFNMDALLVETDEPLLICEGCFDALPYWPDAVACLGKPIEAHIKLFRQAKRPLVVTLDGDAWEEGWAFAMKLRHILGRHVGFVRLPADEDPGTIDPNWLREKARAAAQD